MSREVGVSPMNAWKIASNSARACSTLAPSLRRPTASNHHEPVSVRLIPASAIGRVISTSRPGARPENSGGVTPTTVTGVRPTRITLPMTAGLNPKRRRQYPWLMTAAASSAGPIGRPITVVTPSSSK